MNVVLHGGSVSPYLIWAMSPTTISATGIWMTWPLRMTVNFCSCSMRLCSPRNCFSLDQSLKAVTSTTMRTEKRMAAPSIQPACASPSSSTPDAVSPQSVLGWQIVWRWGNMVSYECPILDECLRSDNDTKKTTVLVNVIPYLHPRYQDTTTTCVIEEINNWRKRRISLRLLSLSPPGGW